jgi:hypothetical protein
LFTLVRVLKITEEARILGLLFSKVKVMYYFGQNGLGNVLGDFFTNSSGHPVRHVLKM